jgi:hypothetical protein
MESDVHRLTTYAIRTLFNDDQTGDLLHKVLREVSPVMWIVMSERGPEGCFFMLTESLKYIAKCVRDISRNMREEYVTLFYYDEANQKHLVSSEEEFIQIIVDNNGYWECGSNSLWVSPTRCYPTEMVG